MAQELNNNKRVYILSAIVVTILVIYILQLFNLQVVSSDYKESAAGNAFLKRTIYPQRGIISDRNGELMVTNQPTFDIVYIPREVHSFDTLTFSSTIGLTEEQFRDKLHSVKFLANGKPNPGYSSYTIQTLITQLNVQEAAVLQEKIYQFPGFFIQKRSLRQYKHPNAGLLLGYVAELNAVEVESDEYYRRGDYGGKSGLESSYEKHLRGEKGTEVLLRDAHGRIKGKYEDGKLDESAISGKNIKLSLDIELQAYGERLMQNKIGCIVMIEPSSGEILAMVSAPSYDPSLLLGREYSNNFGELERNPQKPLYNRATQGLYSPGSTFKPSQGLIALQEQIITKDTKFPCYHGYPPLGGKPKCHTHAPMPALVPAIATSCNSYFSYCLNNMMINRTKYENVMQAFTVWKDHMVSLGFGNKLNVDIPFEKRGFIPNSEYYAEVHKTENWKAANIISIAIGQGEILTTPIQMANFAATIANKGYYYTPHIVKEVQEEELEDRFRVKYYSTIDSIHFETIADGMALAVTGGTCWRTNLMPDYLVCGKTGTVENPHGKDHSMFMGFAPKNNPKVAIFVALENAGFGSTYGVPIGRLMLQKYLRGYIPESDRWVEESMMNAKLLPSSYYTNN